MSDSPQQTSLSEPELTPDQIEIVRVADAAFDQMCQARHDMGRSKYGILTFLEMPTFEMALEELADLSNYARYTFIKIMLLRDSVKKLQQQALGSAEGFFTSEEILGATKEMG
jgi:hypothetical protein